MIIFEFLKDENELIQQFKEKMNVQYDEISIDRLDGTDVIQFGIPLAIALTPIVSEITKTIRDLFSDRRVSIKYNGIELSVMGYDKALKMLKEIQQDMDKREKEKQEDCNNDEQNDNNDGH